MKRSNGMDMGEANVLGAMATCAQGIENHWDSDGDI